MPLDLILPTAVTTVVGILVKSLFDMLKKYIEFSTAPWREAAKAIVEYKMKAQRSDAR